LSAKNTLDMDGSVNTNPYFWSDDLPTLNEWYLIVAFIHGNGYSAGVNHADTGIYSTDGTKMSGINITDFIFSSNSMTLQQRAYLNYDTVLTDNQFFYNPMIHEVTGSEPSIAEMIHPTNEGATTNIWATNGTDINYNSGKVGIGTVTIPTDYQLAVNGKIIATELKVQLQSQWPDYVFKEAYKLPTIEEVAKHIQEKGHLPNIPSAEEVKNNGIEVGEMNKLLLEKIEELTLYTLGQEEKLKSVKCVNKELLKRLEKVERIVAKSKKEE